MTEETEETNTAEDRRRRSIRRAARRRNRRRRNPAPRIRSRQDRVLALRQLGVRQLRPMGTHTEGVSSPYAMKKEDLVQALADAGVDPETA